MSRSANHYFTGASGSTPNYIEEVFSTFLHTGNGGQASQTITNGIDLAGNGGLVWIKSRSNALPHEIVDTSRAKIGQYYPMLNSTTTNADTAGDLTTFNNNGFTVDNSTSYANNSPYTYVSWTFRKQPKFFDVVTWSGNGTTQAISHNLGSVPGFIIIKRTDSADDWWCFHRYDFTQRFKLNATNAATNTNNQSYLGNNTIAVTPTSTTFTVGSISGINASGGTFVAYIYAHDAGGFGLTGTDNVISCGSYVGNGLADGPTVTLGYEPQWLLLKSAGGTDGWQMVDTMRGWTANPGVASSTSPLFPNTAAAEGGISGTFTPTSTGFKINAVGGLQNDNGITYIYIAIRRGPMKVPTVGTSVFGVSRSVEASGQILTSQSGVLADAIITKPRLPETYGTYALSRLTGNARGLLTSSTDAEGTFLPVYKFDNNLYAYIPVGDYFNNAGGFGVGSAVYSFRRAPSFFDVVCYTGTEVSGQTFNHNLGAVPEFMIVKSRSGTTDWTAYHSALGASARIYPNATNAVNTGTAAPWNSTAPTSSVFSLGNAGATNLSGGTFVNYLFATCAGVSKVGSYTGNGTTKQIDCGFTAGARFVLIKRTDSTGDWYVWDTARGIIAGNDPYFLLNSTAVEVTNTDYIDTYSAGFELSSTAPAAINASGGTYIFLAIA